MSTCRDLKPAADSRLKPARGNITQTDAESLFESFSLYILTCVVQRAARMTYLCWPSQTLASPWSTWQKSRYKALWQTEVYDTCTFCSTRTSGCDWRSLHVSTLLTLVEMRWNQRLPGIQFNITNKNILIPSGETSVINNRHTPVISVTCAGPETISDLFVQSHQQWKLVFSVSGVLGPGSPYVTLQSNSMSVNTEWTH